MYSACAQAIDVSDSGVILDAVPGAGLPAVGSDRLAV
jgi:hypothetical protein